MVVCLCALDWTWRPQDERVFHSDIEACPDRGGAARLIAASADPVVIRFGPLLTVNHPLVYAEQGFYTSLYS